MNGDEWVETSPEIVTYFNKKGMNGSDYFIYKGIKVCEYGKCMAILEREAVTMDERLHGAQEATIEGTPA